MAAAASAGSRTRSSTAVSGVLIDDPTDLAEYGSKVTALLNEPERGDEIGRNAMERVREDFLGCAPCCSTSS